MAPTSAGQSTEAAGFRLTADTRRDATHPFTSQHATAPPFIGYGEIQQQQSECNKHLLRFTNGYNKSYAELYTQTGERFHPYTKSGRTTMPHKHEYHQSTATPTPPTTTRTQQGPNELKSVSSAAATRHPTTTTDVSISIAHSISSIINGR